MENYTFKNWNKDCYIAQLARVLNGRIMFDLEHHTYIFLKNGSAYLAIMRDDATVVDADLNFEDGVLIIRNESILCQRMVKGIIESINNDADRRGLRAAIKEAIRTKAIEQAKNAVANAEALSAKLDEIH